MASSPIVQQAHEGLGPHISRNLSLATALHRADIVLVCDWGAYVFLPCRPDHSFALSIALLDRTLIRVPA